MTLIGDLSLADALEADVPAKMRRVVSDLRDEVLAYAVSQPPVGPADQLALIARWTQKQFAATAQLHEQAAAFNARLRALQTMWNAAPQFSNSPKRWAPTAANCAAMQRRLIAFSMPTPFSNATAAG